MASNWYIRFTTLSGGESGYVFPVEILLLPVSLFALSILVVNSNLVSYFRDPITSMQLITINATRAVTDRTYLITTIKRRWRRSRLSRLRCQARNTLIHDELIHAVSCLRK